ncbi:HNH endonuclease protein [Rhizobium phage RHph_Y25]|nr:hypothetical protein AMJ99_CH01054 [Rhizobium esperanzae]ANM33493.1 hypothetical protein AMK04_CH01055 [Rhizobium sp. N871]QIG73724.1 HNH endonuclease protein [Rhizobium phage RHph_N2]QIG74538.1 HNH endonuclease protein [Rhizobium phage RHph_Y25]QXV74442.1 HNH endonuclease protein [Rhizobium phage RHEph18]
MTGNIPAKAPCRICGKPQYAKSLCGPHYTRLLRHGDPLGGGTSPGEPMRFVHEVVLHYTGEDCLSWPFGKHPKGYGQICVDSKIVYAHRYVCELVRGAPPTSEHDAAHSCGKGHEGCVAPGHLVWKTRAENEADKLSHGTHSRGERHVGAKLTEAAVREIINLKGLESQSKLAKRFKVSESLIYAVHAGRAWAWLTEKVEGDAR